MQFTGRPIGRPVCFPGRVAIFETFEKISQKVSAGGLTVALLAGRQQARQKCCLFNHRTGEIEVGHHLQLCRPGK
jgi:hypothetical protein